MKKISFLDFITNPDIDKVKIPKIQREYVQGQNERGHKFVHKIFDKLKKDEEMSLDLVYGSVKDKCFEPIDGQQRLTTLFLLYWYIGKIEIISSDKDGSWLCNILKKFSYDTRSSSKDFCEVLCIKGLSKNFKLSDSILPSDIIMDANWFFIKYKFDYTIKSMLAMLDVIHDEYQDLLKKVPGIKVFDKLDNIKFYIHEMKDYSRAEKLYVIMNDRGKKLTAYENFKSSFIGWLQDNSCNQNQNVITALSENLDNIWSENLWKKNQEEEKHEFLTDKRMYKLFIRYIWVLRKRKGEKPKENLLYKLFLSKEEAKNKNKDIELDFEKYIKPELDSILDERYKGDIEAFCKNLTSYLDYILGNTNNEKVINDFLASPWEQKTVQNYIFSDSYTLPDIVINYGLQLYIEQNSDIDINCISWKEWKRFVWNIFDATGARNSIEQAISAISIIEDKKYGIKDILGELAKQYSCNNVIHHSPEQYEQYEIRKAYYIKNIIKDDLNWRNILDEAEKHKYLKGYIDFLITEINSDEILQEDSEDDFKKRWENAQKIFKEPNASSEYGGFNDSDSHLVIRALLAKVKKITFDEKNLSFCSYETNRDVLKTDIKLFWNKYIKEYVFEDNIDDAFKNAIASAKEIKDTKDTKDFIYWRNELCSNEGLVNWIQERAKKRKQKTSLKQTPNGCRIYFQKWNTSGLHIILNNEWCNWIEKLVSEGYRLQSIDDDEISFSSTDFNGKSYSLYLGATGGKVKLIPEGKDKVCIETKDTQKVKIKANTLDRSDYDSDDAFVEAILGLVEKI